jgi:hypothetical protein
MDVLEGTGAKVPVAMRLPSRVFCRLTVYKKKQVLALQKFQLQAKRSWGFHPRRYGSPICDRPNGYYVIIAKRRAVWGDRHGPLLHHTSASYFIS